MESDDLQIVVFNLQDQEFGVPIHFVKDIIKEVSFTSVPNSSDEIKGVMNLRGKIIVVVDLSKKIGYVEKESDSKTRIIVVDYMDEQIGFRVDGVSETIIISKKDVQPPPAITSNNFLKGFITGVYSKEDRMILLANLTDLYTFEDKNVN